MKHGEGNHAPVKGPASHCFPTFADDGGNVCTDADTSEDLGQFQPLFHGASVSSSQQVSGGRAGKGENQLEQAQQRGYQTGFEAGRQDACQMANDLLSPHVDRFQQNLERLTRCQQNIADHASTHMIKLAVEIAERIMGADAQVTVADLQDLRQMLIEAICKRHELHLSYHPQDLSNLQHLMECKGANQWRSTAGLNIAEDANVAPGSMINCRDAGNTTSIQDQVQSSLRKLLKKTE